MFQFLQALSLVLVAVGMALSLAHALELPGKLRLTRDAYLAVQTIYYPGFTIGGFFGEFGAIVVTFILLIVTPFSGPVFWLTLVALISLLIMHALFWVLTQPVNRIWLSEQSLHPAGAAFFAVGGRNEPAQQVDENWTKLRDRWEYSHVARAVFAMLSFIALVVAATWP